MAYALGSDSTPSVKHACVIACKHNLRIISAHFIECLTWFLTSKMSLPKAYRYCLATLWGGFGFGLVVCWVFLYKHLHSTLTVDAVYSEGSNAMSI